MLTDKPYPTSAASVPYLAIPADIQTAAWAELLECGDDCANIRKYVDACVQQRHMLKAAKGE